LDGRGCRDVGSGVDKRVAGEGEGGEEPIFDASRRTSVEKPVILCALLKSSHTPPPPMFRGVCSKYLSKFHAHRIGDFFCLGDPEALI